MPNRPARFTVAELRRAAKIALEAGLDVEIAPDGTIRLVQPAERKPGKKRPVEPEREIVIW